MSTPTTAQTARIGTMLKGKWRLEAVLGSGGMAVVYSAVHRNGHRAAIKMLHPHVAADERYARRFLREAYAANKVGHPGVPKIVDDDVAEDGIGFLVMELLDGASLKTKQRGAGGKLPLEEVLAAAEQVLEIFAAAHAQGIVHRDIKPDNLFWTKNGKVHVLDFGIAAIRDAQQVDGLTQSGQSMGTHGYMSPEQARGRWGEVDGRSDLFALGATMFMLLAGRRVHEAETANEVLLLEMTEKAAPIGKFVPDLPPAIGAWIDKALLFKKEDRWASAEAMLAGLREARAGKAVSAAQPSESTRGSLSDDILTMPILRERPRRRWVWVGALAATFLAIGGYAFTRAKNEPAAPTVASSATSPLPAASATSPSETVGAASATVTASAVAAPADAVSSASAAPEAVPRPRGSARSPAPAKSSLLDNPHW